MDETDMFAYMGFHYKHHTHGTLFTTIEPSSFFKENNTKKQNTKATIYNIY